MISRAKLKEKIIKLWSRLLLSSRVSTYNGSDAHEISTFHVFVGFLTVYDKTIYYKLCFHTEDVTAAKLASQNNESAVMLEIQTNPVARKPFSYVNTFLCSNKLAWLLTTWLRTLRTFLRESGQLTRRKVSFMYCNLIAGYEKLCLWCLRPNIKILTVVNLLRLSLISLHAPLKLNSCFFKPFLSLFTQFILLTPAQKDDNYNYWLRMSLHTH